VPEQVVPHVMPAGELLTVPVPLPAGVTVSPTGAVAGAGAGAAVNVAVTVVGAVTVTVQGPVPAQLPPLQPSKVEPVAAVAVKVTPVPLL